MGMRCRRADLRNRYIPSDCSFGRNQILRDAGYRDCQTLNYLYATESFRYRDEVVATNGENHTYHAGAYLGDGLHEGAITSALRVAQLIDRNEIIIRVDRGVNDRIDSYRSPPLKQAHGHY